MKKVLNVLGIIIAWILSFVWVLMLIVAPMTLSALSILNADTVTQVVSQGLLSSEAEEPKRDGVTLVTLSDTTGSEDNGNVSASIGDILQQAGLSEDMVNEILSSQATKDLINAYTEDLTNAITGNGDEVQFNPERIKTIVNDNIDEIVNILQDASSEYADMSTEEIKNKLMELIDQNADKIVEALPAPEEFVAQIQNNNPGMKIALQIFAYKNTIKLAIVGAVFFVSLLIFLLRLPGFRGMRWLATDLFVGTGFNALMCGALLMGGSALGALLPGGDAISGVVNVVLSSVTTGMLVRTGIMLVSAVALLVGYIFVKKALARKQAAKQIVEAALQEEAAAEG